MIATMDRVSSEWAFVVAPPCTRRDANACPKVWKVTSPNTAASATRAKAWAMSVNLPLASGSSKVLGFEKT